MVKIRIIAILLLALNSCRAATCTSIANGNWGNSATWSCGHVPTCGDSVVISVSHTVTINSQQDYYGGSGCLSPRMAVVVKGVLYFTGGNKLRLPCSSQVYVYSGGRLDSDGSGSSNQLQICGTVYWNGASGPLYGPACLPPSTNCSAALPVNLVYFKGWQCQDGNCLEWKTASEQNSDFFTVQRSSDGIIWQEAVRLQAHGNTNRPFIYNTADYKLSSGGIVYYRLMEHDLDGSVKYLGIIALDDVFAKTLVYPNPSSGEVFISAPALVSISAVSGEEPLFRKYVQAGKINILLKPGIYICVVGNRVFKLVVEFQ